MGYKMPIRASRNREEEEEDALFNRIVRLMDLEATTINYTVKDIAEYTGEYNQ